jgi:hypothetical protein
MIHHDKCLFHVEVGSKRKVKGNVCVMRNDSHLVPYNRSDTIVFFGMGESSLVQTAITLNDFYLLMLEQLEMPLKLMVKGLLI